MLLNYKALPWVFTPTIVILIIAGVYVEDYDNSPWTQFSVILAAISIAVAIAIFVIQTYQQGEIVEIIQKIDKAEKKEKDDNDEKREYYSKMLVRALGGIKEISENFPILIARNSEPKIIQEEWGRFKAPVERLSSLYVVGANIMDYTILDDIDLIRGTLAEQLDEEMDNKTLVPQIAYVTTLLNEVFLKKLKEKRLEVFKEDLQIIDKQIEFYKLEYKGSDKSEQGWDEYRKSIKSTYSRRYLYPGESDDI